MPRRKNRHEQNLGSSWSMAVDEQRKTAQAERKLASGAKKLPFFSNYVTLLTSKSLLTHIYLVRLEHLNKNHLKYETYGLTRR